jgi:aspartate racemase
MAFMGKRIVIVGGMGPQASLELHRRIIAGAAQGGAKDNEDYPEIVHISIPVPDFISSGNSSAGMGQLKESLNSVKLRKDDQIVLACNTAHLVLPDLEVHFKVHFLSLVDITVRAIGLKSHTIGLLASPTTINMKLYEKPLQKIGKSLLLPTQEEMQNIENTIREVIAGAEPSALEAKFQSIIERMRSKGAEKIILGCTELSLIFSHTKHSDLFDPLDVICRQLVEV